MHHMMKMVLTYLWIQHHFFVTNHYKMQQACGNGKLSLFYFNNFACFIDKEMV
jgi:hypothetical protein